MSKILIGQVMAKTPDMVIVKVTSFRRHPVYKKRVKRDKKLKAAIFGLEVKLGDQVKIVKTRPISKEKHFKILEVIKG